MRWFAVPGQLFLFSVVVFSISSFFWAILLFVTLSHSILSLEPLALGDLYWGSWTFNLPVLWFIIAVVLKKKNSTILLNNELSQLSSTFICACFLIKYLSFGKLSRFWSRHWWLSIYKLESVSLLLLKCNSLCTSYSILLRHAYQSLNI